MTGTAALAAPQVHTAGVTDLVSTREAAALLGVSPSSIKRWADDGLLPCTKTAGSHRRFHRGALETFRDAQGQLAGDLPPFSTDVGDLVEALAGYRPPLALAARLLQLRAARGSWISAATFLGEVLVEVGRRWQRGQLTILEEHLATERLSRALAEAGAWMPLPAGAPRVLLISAERDDHTLGLALVEICLRELGFATLWAGRYMPIEEVSRVMPLDGLRAVAVSASVYSADAQSLARQAEALSALCEPHGVRLVVGGEGAWPERHRYAVRLRGFEGVIGALG